MFPSAHPIRHFLNPRADPSLAYGPEQARILNRRAHQAAFKEISSWDGYAATPLLNLEGMAGRLGIESLWYKDEGARFGLRSFKALGGTYGVFRVLQAFLEGETGIAGIGSGDFSRNRFAVVADTTYPGYEEVPRHIMQGYTVLVRKCLACRNASSLAWRILEEDSRVLIIGSEGPA